MADKRITDLPAAATPAEGDSYPVVQGAATVKQTLQQLRTAIGAVVNSLVGLGGSADKLAYYTDANTLALADFTAKARELVNDTSFTAMLNTLNSDIAVTLASAATVNLGAAASRFVTVTGTSAIASFGTAPFGVTKEITFAGALTLTYNATSLILPGAASITTAAGDSLTAVSLGGGNWKVYDYVRANGKSIAFSYDRSNVLGTVSQASGVPTGAIVERGSNANGEYVKYADGTLIQKFVIVGQSIAVTSAYASVFYGPSSPWLDIPYSLCRHFACRTRGCLCKRSPVRGRSSKCSLAYRCIVRCKDEQSHTSSFTLEYTAIGRWF